MDNQQNLPSETEKPAVRSPLGSVDFILSHTQQRQMIGGLGIIFPFTIIILGKLIFGTELQISLSHYYHTGVRDIYVGILFLIGTFLIFYRGYQDVNYDGRWSTIAGFCAIGTALFPTTVEAKPSLQTEIIGIVHFVFAFSFLAILGLFVLVYFRRSVGDACAEKKRRNRVYTLCGWSVFVSLALIFSIFFLPLSMQHAVTKFKPVLILETIAIVAFGFAWLVKGEWLFTQYLGLLEKKNS